MQTMSTFTQRSELFPAFISTAAIPMFSQLREPLLALCYFPHLFNYRMTAENL